MFENGVEAENAALGAREQMGRIERTGGIWKEAFHRVAQDAQVTKGEDLRCVSAMANQVRNESVLFDGYSPANRALGARGRRMPGSALQDG
eukprot:5548205-Pyramimonas_sp.AAC.1